MIDKEYLFGIMTIFVKVTIKIQSNDDNIANNL